MSSDTVWNFWAPRYHRLLAQKVSLAPTRLFVRERVLELARQGAMAQADSAPRFRLLDVGCGTGQLLGELAGELGPSVELWGVDYAERMLLLARQRLPGATFRCLDASALSDLEGKRFDLIVCTHSLPYYADAPAALRGMLGLLAPGGRLLVVHATAESWYDRLFLALVSLTTGRARYYRRDQLAAMLPVASRVYRLELLRTRRWLSNFVYLEAGSAAGRNGVD